MDFKRLFFEVQKMKIKITKNFAHIGLGMCKKNEIKEIETELAKQIINKNLGTKVQSPKKGSGKNVPN